MAYVDFPIQGVKDVFHAPWSPAEESQDEIKDDDLETHYSPKHCVCVEPSKGIGQGITRWDSGKGYVECVLREMIMMLVGAHYMARSRGRGEGEMSPHAGDSARILTFLAKSGS